MRKFLIFLLVICTVFLCFVIPSFADEGVSPLADTPTDLTGYTVTVPSGWSSSIFYIEPFYINGIVPATGGNPFSSFVFELDNILFKNSSDVLMASFDSSFTFSFTVTGGADVSNSTLLEWLSDNNATFTRSDPEPDPNPAVTLSGGNYYLNLSISYPYLSEWFDDGYTYSYSADGYYYVGSLPHHFNVFNYEFKSLTDDQNYHLVFSVDTDSGEVVPLYDIFCVNGRYTVDSLDGLIYFSLDEDVVLDLNSRTTFEHFFKTYAPDTPVFDGNPWSYILEMVIEALKVKIWGYFSVWDIVTTLCGIFIATWLLKLLAGG